MSMSLRGWVTEDDELVTLGSDRRPDGHRHSRLHRSGRRHGGLHRRRQAASRTGKRWSIPAPPRSAASATTRTAAPGWPVELDVEASGISRGRQGGRPAAHRPCQHLSVGQPTQIDGSARIQDRQAGLHSKATSFAPVAGVARRRQSFLRQCRSGCVAARGVRSERPDAEGPAGSSDLRHGPRSRPSVSQLAPTVHRRWSIMC